MVKEHDDMNVGVFVDYPAGLISYKAQVPDSTMFHLYTFEATFTQPLYAGFGVSSLKLSSLVPTVPSR
jgi:hypothetical protein